MPSMVTRSIDPEQGLKGVIILGLIRLADVTRSIDPEQGLKAHSLTRYGDDDVLQDR